MKTEIYRKWIYITILSVILMSYQNCGKPLTIKNSALKLENTPPTPPVPIPESNGNPKLRFSDLISGPDTGLGDGKGSGAIVTVWGQHLGSTQGTNKIEFCDSTSTCRSGYVYYWKNADGALPSGPSNLFASHKMQEIAFSIPDSAFGAGTIKATINGEETSLPFLVRAGNIYFVNSTGNDTSGNGSFGSPWRSTSKAGSTAPAGSTIYVHNVNTGSNTSERGIYWNKATASSNMQAQYSFVAYPGFQPKVSGQKGVETYNTEALVISKFDIYSSNYTAEDANGQPSGSVIKTGGTWGIKSSKNGRAIANRIGDIPGGCASKYQGAIAGDAKTGDRISNYKIFGNEVYDYGCEGSQKLHHTTYMSIRSKVDITVDPWEFGFNYLHGNKAKFGIHQFDQDQDGPKDGNDYCGDTTGPILIHNNVIIDQAGAGISVGSQCGWTMNVVIENNILINVGNAADYDGKDPNTANGAENGGIGIRDSGLYGTMFIRNNTIYKHTTDGQTKGGGCLNLTGSGDNVSIVWENNICYSEIDHPFVWFSSKATNQADNIIGSNNIWHYTGGTGAKAKVPTWDSNAIIAAPMLSVSGPRVIVQGGSSAIGQVMNSLLGRDLYGVLRPTSSAIGAVEFTK